jgi:hypothetical protein
MVVPLLVSVETGLQRFQEAIHTNFKFFFSSSSGNFSGLYSIVNHLHRNGALVSCDAKSYEKFARGFFNNL